MFVRAIAMISALLLLAGCATSSGPATPVAADPALAAGTEPSLAPAYTLGSGDQLRIIVFGEENLSGEFFVDGAGMVSD